MNQRSAVVARFAADPTAPNREAVILAHRYLCSRGARKFARPPSERADLEQVAALGLIKATDSYRPERATPFEAYAWLVIVGELMHYVRDHERAIRVPRALRSLERRYAAAWERLAAQRGIEPSAALLATALGVEPAAIAELEAMRRGNRIADGADSRSASLACDALPAPAPGLGLAERITVSLAIDALTRREQTIVVGTFAVGLSQTEIAGTLGLSQSQVSKILQRALGKLQQRVA